MDIKTIKEVVIEKEILTTNRYEPNIEIRAVVRNGKISDIYWRKGEVLEMCITMRQIAYLMNNYIEEWSEFYSEVLNQIIKKEKENIC